jgi:FlaG/FlaF family flagellin (archaellin)
MGYGRSRRGNAAARFWYWDAAGLCCRSMRILTFTLMLLASTVTLAATIYKWVDEKGVTHYSDQPHESAQKVEVTSAQTYTPPPAAPTVPERPVQAAASYSLCEIFSPQNDEVFFNTQSVTARVRLEPELQAGHRLAVALDGKRASDSNSASDFTLTPVYRGTHTVAAVVEDAKTGQTVCTTPSITFHVRQPSDAAPNRANRPGF